MSGPASGAEPWREAHRLLAARSAACAGAVARALREPAPALPFDPAAVRRIWATGLGSSAAHARFLVQLLAGPLALPARFAPAGAFLSGPPEGAEADLLVVVSQGLSPNARFALSEPRRWRQVVLLTAVAPDPPGAERRALLAELAAAGGLVLRFPGEDEVGTLLRLLGPMTGYAAALRLARALARAGGARSPALEVDPDLVGERVAGAPEALARALEGIAPAALAAPLAFLASGDYAELAHNLRLKWMEGLLRPFPPAWELLELAHGPLQQAFPGPATFAALARSGAPRETELLARLEAALSRDRHHLLRLPSALPSPFAIFEHEALLNELVLRRMAEERLDNARWPGRGAEALLYDLAPGSKPEPPAPAPAPPAEPPPAPGPAAPPAPRGGSSLEELAWPELEARLASGSATAVLALGATEQHGPHLPLATDSWIAEALAERFCARVPEAIRVPLLRIGCSSEHLAFPGTLHLRPETLRAVLEDVLASLRRHGFARAFLFSAHGGNRAALRAALPALAGACAPLRLIAHTDLGELTARLHARSRGLGIDPAASGHHAGELETSIVAALHPGAVRRDRLAAGLLCGAVDAEAIFAEGLRARAPSGTVGDPRGADPRRAEAYLETWTALLVDHYLRERNTA
jgi:creatinine amidohydrolase